MKFVAFIFLGSLLWLTASCIWFVKSKLDTENVPEKILMSTGAAAIVGLVTGFVTAVYIIARL